MAATRSEVERFVRAVIEDLTGTPANQIEIGDRLVEDLKIDGDDFTFVFVPTIEKALGVRTNASAWWHVSTVQDAIDTFLAASTGDSSH